MKFKKIITPIFMLSSLFIYSCGNSVNNSENNITSGNSSITNSDDSKENTTTSSSEIEQVDSTSNSDIENPSEEDSTSNSEIYPYVDEKVEYSKLKDITSGNQYTLGGHFEITTSYNGIKYAWFDDGEHALQLRDINNDIQLQEGIYAGILENANVLQDGTLYYLTADFANDFSLTKEENVEPISYENIAPLYSKPTYTKNNNLHCYSPFFYKGILDVTMFSYGGDHNKGYEDSWSFSDLFNSSYDLYRGFAVDIKGYYIYNDNWSSLDKILRNLDFDKDFAPTSIRLYDDDNNESRKFMDKGEIFTLYHDIDMSGDLPYSATNIKPRISYNSAIEILTPTQGNKTVFYNNVYSNEDFAYVSYFYQGVEVKYNIEKINNSATSFNLTVNGETSINLNLGDVVDYEVKANPEGSSLIPYMIEDSNGLIRIVNGKLVALKAGTTRIFARANSDKYYRIGSNAVNVTIHNVPSKTLTIGEVNKENITSPTLVKLNYGYFMKINEENRLYDLEGEHYIVAEEEMMQFNNSSSSATVLFNDDIMDYEISYYNASKTLFSYHVGYHAIVYFLAIPTSNGLKLSDFHMGKDHFYDSPIYNYETNEEELGVPTQKIEVSSVTNPDSQVIMNISTNEVEVEHLYLQREFEDSEIELTPTSKTTSSVTYRFIPRRNNNIRIVYSKRNIEVKSVAITADSGFVNSGHQWTSSEVNSYTIGGLNAKSWGVCRSNNEIRLRTDSSEDTAYVRFNLPTNAYLKSFDVDWYEPNRSEINLYAYSESNKQDHMIVASYNYSTIDDEKVFAFDNAALNANNTYLTLEAYSRKGVNTYVSVTKIVINYYVLA